MPPQANALLTLVTGASAATGGRDDWDAPAPAGDAPVKWAGEEPAYYTEDARFTPAADGADHTTTRKLIVDTHIARDIAIDTDDVVTWTGAGAGTARVTAIAFRELEGLPLELQTTKLELEVT